MTVSISRAQRLLCGGLTVALVVGLAVTALLRTYAFSDATTPVRTAIGETRWFDLASQAHLHALLGGLPKGDIARVELPAGLLELEVDWVVAMLRYACPGSDVAIASSEQSLPTKAVVIAPSCAPAWPEFLRVPLGQPDESAVAKVGAALRLVLSMAICWLVGMLVLSGRTLLDLEVRVDGWPRPSAVTIVVGLAVATLGGTVATMGGLVPEVGMAMATGLAVLITTVRGLRDRTTLDSRPRRAELERGAALAARRLRRLSGLEVSAAAVAFGLFVVTQAKAWFTALWSWDHHFIWGLKARQLGEGSRLFLEQDGYSAAAAHYPIAIPVSSVVGTLGAVPAAIDFHLQWGLWLGLLAALTFNLLDRCSRLVRYLGVGLVMATPIVWDGEGMGLAELPLLVFSLAALQTIRLRVPGARWGTVLVLMVVAQAKPEGIVVVVTLAPVLWLLGRDDSSRDGTWTVAWALLGSCAIVLLSRWLLPTGNSFASGNALSRLQGRAQAPLEILRPAVEQLLHSTWLGTWALVAASVALLLSFALAAKLAPVGMREVAPTRSLLPSLTLFTAAAAIATIYLGVYFVTYNDPEVHILTSWHRILGPPAVWIAIAFCWLLQAICHRRVTPTAADAADCT